MIRILTDIGNEINRKCIFLSIIKFSGSISALSEEVQTSAEEMMGGNDVCTIIHNYITLKMADQGLSELHVVLTTILCGSNFFTW